MDGRICISYAPPRQKQILDLFPHFPRVSTQHNYSKNVILHQPACLSCLLTCAGRPSTACPAFLTCACSSNSKLVAVSLLFIRGWSRVIIYWVIRRVCCAVVDLLLLLFSSLLPSVNPVWEREHCIEAVMSELEKDAISSGHGSNEKQQIETNDKLVAPKHHPDVDADEIDEKKLIRKLDWALIPWLSFLYLLSFLDRTSIGNAKVRQPHSHCRLQY